MPSLRTLLLPWSLAILASISCGQSPSPALRAETGEALALGIQAAIENKDAAALGELTDARHGDGDFLQSIHRQIAGEIPVRSVEFSAVPVDDVDPQVDESDGDIIITFTEPSQFTTRGNAAVANITQISLPAMRIDGFYRIHDGRDVGMSDVPVN